MSRRPRARPAQASSTSIGNGSLCLESIGSPRPNITFLMRMGEFNRSEAWTDDRRVLQHVGNHCKAAHQSSLAMKRGRPSRATHVPQVVLQLRTLARCRHMLRMTHCGRHRPNDRLRQLADRRSCIVTPISACTPWLKVAPRAPARFAGQSRDRGFLHRYLLLLREQNRIAMKAVCTAE